MSETMWMDEVDGVEEKYGARQIDRVTAERRLRALGFDPDEIEEMLAPIDEDLAE